MNCSYNTATGAWICTIGGTIVWRPGTLADENVEILIDSPSGWAVPNSTASLDALINFGEPSEQTFSVPLSSTTTNVEPIDTYSTVISFVGDLKVIQDATSAHDSDNESQFTSEFVVEQTSCDIPSGEYTFHIRGKDSFGISYIGSKTIAYLAPSEGSCVGSSITVK